MSEESIQNEVIGENSLKPGDSFPEENELEKNTEPELSVVAHEDIPTEEVQSESLPETINEDTDAEAINADADAEVINEDSDAEEPVASDEVAPSDDKIEEVEEVVVDEASAEITSDANIAEVPLENDEAVHYEEQIEDEQAHDNEVIFDEPDMPEREEGQAAEEQNEEEQQEPEKLQEESPTQIPSQEKKVKKTTMKATKLPRVAQLAQQKPKPVPVKPIATSKRPTTSIASARSQTSQKGSQDAKKRTQTLNSARTQDSKLVRLPWNKAAIQPRVQTMKFGPKEYRKEMIKENKVKKADFSGKDISDINLDEYFLYEYLYLRDMELKGLDIFSIFPNLRVLDLSSNMIESLDFLQNMPALRHLSISSNALRSLESLPANLIEMESFSVGNNKIESFVGMPAFESLRVLNIQSNFIENFNGFPILQSLDTLDLRENPLVLNVGSEQLKEIALALHRFTSLKRVNGSVVNLTPEEYDRVFAKFDGKVSYCIREGYLPPALMAGVKVSEDEEIESINLIRTQAAAHLVQNQKLKTEGSPFELYHIELSPTPIEGAPTSISVIFKVKEPEVVIESDELAKHTFTSMDESHEYLVINGHHVPMDKHLSGTHTVTVLLPKGTYSYGFAKAVNEVPEKLSEISFNEPCTNESAESINYYFLIQWFKLNAVGLFEELPDSNGLSVSPNVSDISSHLKSQVFCFDSESNIVFSVFDISDKVQETGPQCRSLSIVGDLIQGQTLTVQKEYFGGIEGESSFVWIGAENRRVEGPEYKIELSDVENTVRLQYTPVRNDGVKGTPVTVESDVIVPSCPQIVDLQIHGVVQEGESISVTYGYQGGYQGDCAVQWMRQNGETGEFEAIPGENNNEYRLTLADVNHKIMACVTPVSDKGVAGPDSTLETEVVAPAHPRLLSLDITALKLEEDKIIVTEPVYYGGYEGKSQIKWYRVSAPENEEEEPQKIHIEEANDSHMYKCMFEDVGFRIEVAYTPRRDDGVFGETVYQQTDGVVKSGPPKCSSIHIEGEPVQNESLHIAVEYKGGSEGSSSYRWYRVSPDAVKDKEEVEEENSGETFKIEGELVSKSSEYKLTLEDVGYRIRVEYIPVREDGVEGELVTAYTEVVKALPPQLSNVTLAGSFEEYGRIYGSADYFGGFEKERRHKWIKLVSSEDSSEERLEVDFATESEYFLADTDVNARLIYACQTVSTDDIESEWVESEPSPVITPQMPFLSSGAFSGLAQEGCSLEVDVQGDNFTKEASKVEWYKVMDSEEFVAADTWSLELAIADIGSVIRCKVTPVRPEFDLVGEPFVVDSEVVRPSAPVVSNVQQSGAPIEGGSISVSYDYYGGYEGASQIKWFRVGSSTVHIPDFDNQKEYSITTADLNCCIRSEVTPVRDDGVDGEPLYIDSAVVTGAGPTLSNLSFSGEAFEGKSLSISYQYYGGIEGASEKEWYRIDGDKRTLLASNTTTYDIQLEDIDYIIECVCTPVRDDGEKGESLSLRSEKVGGNPPVVTNVQVAGDAIVSGTLQISGAYAGGIEGESIFVWESSESRSGPWISIAGANSRQYSPTPDDLNTFIRATYTPVRRDGEKGSAVESPVVKIHMGADHFQSMIQAIHQRQCNITDSKPTIVLDLKNIIAEDFKSNYSSLSIAIDASNEKQFSMTEQNKSKTVEANSRKSRDNAVLAARLFNGIAQNDLCNAIFGKEFAAAWKKKKNIPASLEAAQLRVTATEKPSDHNLGLAYEVMKSILSQDM